VSFEGRKYGPGSGKNKKDAEQMAAGMAFKQVGEQQS
jgi:dsRNA-specific ribonuclease